jgi:hypothetical protein
VELVQPCCTSEEALGGGGGWERVHHQHCRGRAEGQFTLALGLHTQYTPYNFTYMVTSYPSKSHHSHPMIPPIASHCTSHNCCTCTHFTSMLLSTTLAGNIFHQIYLYNNHTENNHYYTFFNISVHTTNKSPLADFMDIRRLLR